MLDGQVDWRKDFPVVTDDSGKRSQAYRGRRGQGFHSHVTNEDDDDEGGSGMYEVMKDIKRMCNLLWMQKVVHMRRMGVRYAQAHGAVESEIDLLGGWAVDRTKTDVSENCRKHYLWNLDPQALICQAGFYRDERYMCPRSWMIDLTNDEAIISNQDIVSVVEFIIPGLIPLYLEVKKARYTPHLIRDPNIPSSKSNHCFLRAMVISIVCWVQDAKIMLQEYSCLQRRAPYSWLFVDDNVQEAFERIGSRVLSDMARAPTQLNDIQLERRDLLGCIEENNSRLITSFQTSQDTQLQDLQNTTRDFAQNLHNLYQGQLHGESVGLMRQVSGNPIWINCFRTTHSSNIHACHFLIRPQMHLTKWV